MKMKHFILPIILLMAFSCSPSKDDGEPGFITGKTLLDRSVELANNVDELPTSERVYGNETKKNKKKNNISVKEHEKVSNEELYASDVWEHTMVPSQILHYDILDSNIRSVVDDIKPSILSHIIQLNTWVLVYDFGDNSKQFERMSYDANKDEVKLERIQTFDNKGDNRGVSYTVIYSSYDENNKICIYANKMRYEHDYNHNVPIYGTMSMMYVEDTYYLFSCFEPILVSSGAPTTAKRIILEKDFTKNDGYLAIDFIQEPYGNSGEYDIEYLIHRRFFHDQNFMYKVETISTEEYGSQTDYTIADLKGKVIAEISEEGSYRMNLYYTGGWDRAEYYLDDDGLTAVRLYNNGELLNIPCNNGESLRNGIHELLNTKYTETPNFSHNKWNEEDPSDAISTAALLDKFLEDNNLPFKYNLKFEDIISNVKQIVLNTKVYGDSYYLDIDKPYIHKKYEEMKLFEDYSEEQLNNLVGNNYISKNEQKRDENLYEFFKVQVNGEPLFNEDNVSFENITVHVERNALLNPGDLLAICVNVRTAFSNASGEIAHFTFNGEKDIVISFADFSLFTLAGDEGDYSVEFYVANAGAGGYRMSNYFTFTSPTVHQYVHEVEDLHYYYTYTFKIDDKGISYHCDKEEKPEEEQQNPSLH